MRSSRYLVGVSQALPQRIQALSHVYDDINLFAMPSTLAGVARSGRLELVREYFGVISITSRAIAGAAAEGHLHVVQWIYSHLEYDDLTQWVWVVEAFKAAASNSQLNVLTWLEVQCEPMLWVVEEIAVKAAISGQVAVLQWVDEYFGAGVVEEALAAVIVAGKRDMEEYLLSICDDNTCLNALGSALRTVAANNELDRVKELSPRCREADVQRVLASAIGRDAYEVVKILWLSSQPRFLSEDGAGISGLDMDNAIKRAFLNDRVDIAALYIDVSRPAPSRYRIGAVLGMAVAAHRLDFVQLLYTKCEVFEVDSALTKAAADGHWDIVQVVYERSNYSWVGRALGSAASSCRWDVVAVLFGRCEKGCFNVGYALKQAVMSVELEMVELLCRKSKQRDIDAALCIAVDNNRLDVVKALYAKCETYTVDRVLEKAASQSRWDLVHVMYANAGIFTLGDVLLKAAETGQWDTVKLVYGKCRSYDVGLALAKVASCGQLDIVELLREKCSVNAIGGALTKAASDRRWDVVKLLQDKAEPYYVGIALKKAVSSDQLDVVELLCRSCATHVIATSISAAAMNSHWRTVELLSRTYGDKVAATAGVRNLADVLVRAAAEKQLDVVNMLSDKCDPYYLGAALSKATPIVQDVLVETCGASYIREARKLARLQGFV